MSKAPAFQFYANDFMDATRFWEANACGLFIRCLCIQWTQGAIPSDHRMLSKGVGMDMEEFTEAWKVVSTKFEVCDDGLLRNSRLEEVRTRQVEVSHSRSEAGKLGAIAKANAKANAYTKTQQRKVKEKIEEEEEEREGEGKERVKEKPTTGKIEDIRFETLWAAYGRIGSKPEAMRYWQALSDPDRMAIEAKLPAYVASTPGGAYRKHLQGWINPKNRLWESAIVTHVNNTTNGQSSEQQRAANYERILAERYPNG